MTFLGNASGRQREDTHRCIDVGPVGHSCSSWDGFGKAGAVSQPRELVKMPRDLRSRRGCGSTVKCPHSVADYERVCWNPRGDCNLETHEIHGSPWQASHALMRLYRTVLHLHVSPLSTPVGPVYEFPGNKEGISNAAHANKIACDVPQVHLLTAIITCRCQVCCDRAGVLLKRIECLSKYPDGATNRLLLIQKRRLIERNRPKQRYRRYNS